MLLSLSMHYVADFAVISYEVVCDCRMFDFYCTLTEITLFNQCSPQLGGVMNLT